MSHKFPIPEAALSQHIIALGKTGSGKSSKMRVIVEKLLDAGMPVCILDPKGDWWGLKSSADGKKAGYPIVIFGGEHADVPLNAHSGSAVAELIATGNRPALIDLGGWMIGERTRFFVDFAAAFFRSTKGKRYLVIDECHNFAPQGRIMDPDAGKMLHWANRLASEGRGKGVTLIAASQRPQKVHKDFVTSCETLIACRVIHKLDRDAIKDWIDGCADPQKGKDVLTQLAGMKRDEAWCWSPEIDYGPERVTWPMFKTYDSFAPQAADVKLKGWASVDLDDVRAKLSTAIADAEANDPKRLRAEIRQLEKDLLDARQARPVKGSKRSEQQVQAARADGYQRGYLAGADHGRQRLADKREEYDRLGKALHRALQTGLNERAPLYADEVPKLREIPLPRNLHSAAAVSAPAVSQVAHSHAERVDRGAGGLTRSRMPVPPRSPKIEQHARARSPEIGNGQLPQGEAKILAALIAFPTGRTREQLKVLTGYASRSLTTYLPRLMGAGFVSNEGGVLVATAAGREQLPDAAPLPQGVELQEHWLARLPEGERKLLIVLLKAQGQPVSREDLQRETSYAPRSLTTYLPRMVAKGIVVTDRGSARASGDLF